LIFPSQDTALSEEDMTKYRVHVKTGDKRGAGTDADVFRVLLTTFLNVENST